MNRMRLSLLLFSIILPTLAEDRPNIVVILADDLGYGDVQHLNQKSVIPTPNLNRLAEEGMTFTDAHSPSAVCTPTRYGLLTGRYCWRTKLKRGVLNGYGRSLIQPDRRTLAHVLQSAGYKTGIVGKWHLGLDFILTGNNNESIDYSKPVSRGPKSYGFDFSYIIPASLDFPPYVYIKNHQITQFPSATQEAWRFPAFVRKGPRSPVFRMADALDHLIQEAVTFIHDKSEKKSPFFLYLPLTGPHKPVLPHPRFLGKTEAGLYGDFVHQVDWSVGQINQAIQKAGIKDKTLVIFTSDNGSFMYRENDPSKPDHLDTSSVQAFHSETHTANHVYRGTKADIWEAGHRVPFFVRWPGRIRPESRSKTPICHTDILATCAAAAGVKTESGVGPDSFSLMPELIAPSGFVSDHPPIINHSAGGMFAIREGQWKLVLGNGSGGRQQPKGKPFGKPFQLFDLSRDSGETFSLATDRPDIVQDLTSKFYKIAGSDL